MIQKKSKLKKLGTTLIDTIVGIFIFSVVLSSGFALLKYSTSLYSAQNDLSIANTILNFVAEDLKSREYTGITIGYNYSSAYTSGSLRTSEMDNLKNAVVTVTATEPETGLKKVVLVLQWASVNGLPHSQSVILYFSSTDII